MRATVIRTDEDIVLRVVCVCAQKIVSV